MLGFLTMAIVYLLLALSSEFNADPKWVFFLFCMSSFAINIGVSVGTFVLPAVSFPVSTFVPCKRFFDVSSPTSQAVSMDFLLQVQNLGQLRVNYASGSYTFSLAV